MNVSFLDMARLAQATADETDDAVKAVTSSGRVILGPEVLAFEQAWAETCGVAHAVGVGSGTDALEVALRDLLLVEGREVSSTLLRYYIDKSHPDVRVVPSLAEALDDDPIQVMFGATVGEMEALRVILHDALGDAARIDRTFYPHLDAGGGWLIFKLPPTEIAMHPAGGSAASHEFYFMCDDIDATVEELTAKGVEFSQPVTETRWGRLVRFQLPGGGELGMYEPRHDRATDL